MILAMRRAAMIVSCLALALLALSGQAFAYGYNYKFDVVRDVGAEDAFAYVKNHFSSTFPAAKKFGNCGETLYVGLECDLVGGRKGHIRIEEVGSRHFVVRSLPGHFEGANKLINFTLANNYSDPSDRMLRLEISATGKDNLWQKIPFAKRGNRVFASDMWSDFATKIRNEVYAGNIWRTQGILI